MRLFKVIFFSMFLLFLGQGILFAADDTSATDSVDSQTHFFGFPILSQSPETGFAVGGYFMAYRYPNPANQVNMDSLTGILIYTEKEQLILNLGVNKYFQDDRYLLTVDTGYVDFPSYFYGIGTDNKKDIEDLEEEFTLISKSFQGSFLLKISPNIYFGPTLAYCHFDVEDREAGGLLTTGDINGSDGVIVSGGGFKLIRDTRDDGFLPQHGSLFDVQVTGYRKSWGSDEDFSQLITNYRRFWPFRETGTFALMTTLELSDGEVPFEMMPSLGGLMRGYMDGRFRDNNCAVFQGEYRFPIITRLSGVAFAGLGEVAPEIDKFNSDNIKAAGGFGLRFRIDPNQKINLRFDIGLSEDGVYTYINFMEAF